LTQSVFFKSDIYFILHAAVEATKVRIKPECKSVLC